VSGVKEGRRMATIAFSRPVTATVKFLKVEAGVRYWEDADVNDQSDNEGDLMPFRSGDMWCPTIDLDSGVVVDWPRGTSAHIHYKVCDEGVYTLLDGSLAPVRKIEGYVPKIMSPGGDGYGDYIIMDIDGDGAISDWRVTLDEFEGEEE
jgi:hypothetical protein